jgi:hypothetical protein
MTLRKLMKVMGKSMIEIIFLQRFHGFTCLIMQQV